MVLSKCVRVSCVLFTLLFLADPVLAVLIHQVYYDPAQESGSEAIEFHNDKERPVDISNWTITTEGSDPDATVPRDTILLPDQYFLLADKNWSSLRDNLDWPLADYEESITLKNANSGVILKDAAGAVVDKVGWGNTTMSTGLPVFPVKQGLSLLRVANVGDNLRDFVPATPSFAGLNGGMIGLNVTTSVFTVSIEDDDSVALGIQVRPIAGKTRLVAVRAASDGPVSVVFQGSEQSLARNSTGQWVGSIRVPYSLAPDTYGIRFVTENHSDTLEFEYLPLKAWVLESRTAKMNAVPEQVATYPFAVRNTGNVPVAIAPVVSDLNNTQTTIPAQFSPVRQTVEPAGTVLFTLRLTVPTRANGRYTGSVLFREV